MPHAGAILSQITDGNDLPIAYASKSFTKGEKSKPTMEKELTAIHWAVNYFKPYIFGKKFKVRTDHRPLVYLFNMNNPTSKVTRMKLDLEGFDFEVEFVQGKTNTGADALSRIVIDSDKLKQMQKNNANKTNDKSLLAVKTGAMTRLNNFKLPPELNEG